MKKLAKELGNSSVSDAEAKKFYNDNINKFKYPDKVRASHILISVNPVEITEIIKSDAKNKNLDDSAIKAKVNEDANAKLESDGTLVALQGKTMSEEQRRIIMSLHIREVIVCLDLDVPIEEVMSICDKFYGLRKVSFIYVPKDERDMFDPKDSPCDASNDVYKRLFINRIEYDDRAHMAYLKMIGK